MSTLASYNGHQSPNPFIPTGLDLESRRAHDIFNSLAEAFGRGRWSHLDSDQLFGPNEAWQATSVFGSGG